MVFSLPCPNDAKLHVRRALESGLGDVKAELLELVHFMNVEEPLESSVKNGKLMGLKASFDITAILYNEPNLQHKLL